MARNTACREEISSGSQLLHQIQTRPGLAPSRPLGQRVKFDPTPDAGPESCRRSRCPCRFYFLAQVFGLRLELSLEFLNLRQGPRVRERNGRIIRKDPQPTKLFLVKPLPVEDSEHPKKLRQNSFAAVQVIVCTSSPAIQSASATHSDSGFTSVKMSDWPVGATWPILRMPMGNRRNGLSSCRSRARNRRDSPRWRTGAGRAFDRGIPGASGMPRECRPAQ